MAFLSQKLNKAIIKINNEIAAAELRINIAQSDENKHKNQEVKNTEVDTFFSTALRKIKEKLKKAPKSTGIKAFQMEKRIYKNKHSFCFQNPVW